MVIPFHRFILLNKDALLTWCTASTCSGDSSPLRLMDEDQRMRSPFAIISGSHLWRGRVTPFQSNTAALFHIKTLISNDNYTSVSACSTGLRSPQFPCNDGCPFWCSAMMAVSPTILMALPWCLALMTISSLVFKLLVLKENHYLPAYPQCW